jgi:glycosyltransferase involved in cell wall biosynthesis
MRVLHVIPSVAARYGGPSTAIASMCRALTTLGVEPLIVTTNADGSARLQVPVGETTTWEGVPAIFFNRNFSESFKYSRGLSRWLSEHLHRFDLVHVHALLSHASLAASAEARRRGVPYVIRPLGTVAPWSLGQHKLRKRAMLRLGARQLLHDAAAVHCTSHQEKRDVEQTTGASNCVVIPLGIDPSILSSTSPGLPDRERHPYCLALSRLHPKKNLEAVIESFLEATASRREWRLVIAGSGDRSYTDRLERLVKARDSQQQVSIVGWVGGSRKRELIDGASVFVLASFHENFGVSVLEALGRGVPALTSRAVDLAEQIEKADAGWIVDTTRESLVDGFTRAFSDCTGGKHKGDNARALAARFAWPLIAGQLVALYTRLAGKPAESRMISKRVFRTS